ncbi:TPA: hypothetical protein ACRZSU_001614 [Campylobacter jejuni]
MVNYRKCFVDVILASIVNKTMICFIGKTCSVDSIYRMLKVKYRNPISN